MIRRFLYLSACLIPSLATAQIAPSEYLRTFSSTLTRGFVFQAPTNFIITGIRVPDEKQLGQQVVAIYRFKAKPPAYSRSVQSTPAFFKKDIASQTVIRVSPPLIIRKGEWLGTLGACYSKTAPTRMANSYGARSFKSTVLGFPITLERMLMQKSINGNQGVGGISTEANGSLARVYLYVAGQGRSEAYGTGSTATSAPTLRQNDNTSASINTLTSLRMLAPVQNQGGLLVLGLGRLKLPTPHGTLLIKPPFLGPFFSGAPIRLGKTGFDFSFRMPNDKNLLGGKLNWQTALIVAPKLYLSNGLEQSIGR